MTRYNCTELFGIIVGINIQCYFTFTDAIVTFSQSDYAFDEGVNQATVNIEIDRNLETTATVT
jgi:hypothetical protein